MQPDPLFEWNRLENENSKHAVVSTMYLGVLARSPHIEAFTTWLLAGTGAAATLLIANIQSISAVIGRDGFQICMSLLVVSALFGLFTKCATVFFPVNSEAQTKLNESIVGLLGAHSVERKKLKRMRRNVVWIRHPT